jgi:hypothetical protein
MANWIEIRRRLFEIFALGPLTEPTHKDGRSLAITAIAIYLIVELKLVPCKIDFFGIELADPDRVKLVTLLKIVLAYLLARFVVLASSDIVKLGWHFHEMKVASAHSEQTMRTTEALQATHRDQSLLKAFEHANEAAAKSKLRRWFYASAALTVVRGLIDLVVPILIAIVSLCVNFQ